MIFLCYCNFCFYVEKFNLEYLKKIKNIPEKQRYNVDGTPTPDMKKILESVYKNGKTILHKNSDISKNCVKGKQLDQNTFHNMTDLLNKYSKYWEKCSYFIIEQQMSFGKRFNRMAMKLAQHCYSYFKEIMR